LPAGYKKNDPVFSRSAQFWVKAAEREKKAAINQFVALDEWQTIIGAGSAGNCRPTATLR
jgi:hypothetical protein